MKPFRLGLTGSIGMGKSTTAALFAAMGVPVWDADAAVHRLYAPKGAAVPVIAKAFPGALTAEGGISRDALKSLIRQDAAVLDRLSALIHPLVAADRAEYIAKATQDIVLLDVPLMFEIGADKDCDAVLVVTAPPEVQRARVLARKTMTEADFNTILARQMPDAEKRSRAHHVVETLSVPQVQAYVIALLDHIRQTRPHA